MSHKMIRKGETWLMKGIESFFNWKYNQLNRTYSKLME